jgi:UDP-glucose 4-epimerase
LDAVVLDDLSTGSRANLDGVDVDFVEGSILDKNAVARVARGASAIIHLAGRPSVPRSLDDPSLTNEINVTGTIGVLEAARATDVFTVVASSSSVYGANRVMPTSELVAPDPVSPYAVSKLAAEMYALVYQRCFGLPVLALRLFNVFGPLQPPEHAYVVPRFVQAALTHRPLEVHGDGRQTRDFTYVGTVATVLSEAVVRRVVWDGPVNLAFGSRVSLMDLIEELEDLLGRPLAREHLPSRPGDVRDTQADNHLLRSLFPDVGTVSLREGLAQTIEWFRTRPEPLRQVLG